MIEISCRKLTDIHNMKGHSGQPEVNSRSIFINTNRIEISFRKSTNINYMNGQAGFQTEKKAGSIFINTHKIEISFLIN